MTITGTIYTIYDTVTVSQKFTKREFVVKTEGQYPQHILLQVTNDNTRFLDDFTIGQEVEVSFNLRGKEWKNPSGEIKFFNTLEAWKIIAK